MRRAPPPDTEGEDPTATHVRREPHPRPLGAIVEVHDAAATPRTFRLASGRCVLGSAPGSSIVIAESTVSRQHAEIVLVPEGVMVHDLGSRNGVYYLGQRVERIVLPFGGRIQMGAATVSIDVDVEALQAGTVFAGEEYRGMVGRSPSMRRLFAMLSRLEGSLVTVLVEGESGAGKELIARALHDGSSAASGPLTIVNCGAIPRELVASELFGHKRGAFTGASDARKGAFEASEGGTLFLDEIGELPVEVQPMLLRALESGEIRPVGGDVARVVKVRVVAATNRDLEAEARAGRFREDLFYRIAVVRLLVPPLRERPEDVDLLARKFGAAAGLGDVPAEVIERLRARTWPGNARELRNVIQAYAALGSLPESPRSTDAALDAALNLRIDVARPYGDQKEELVDRFTRLYLQALLHHAGGNQTQASRLAGLDRGYLGRLLVKYGLVRP